MSSPSIRNWTLHEWAWLVPAFVLLIIARLIIIIAPFRWIAARLGDNQGPQPQSPLVTEKQADRALQLGRTVRRAAKLVPTGAHCFPQAIVASLLLRLYGIPYAIHFGLRKKLEDGDDNKALAAHAWVNAGKIRVTGGQSFHQFTTVACFVSPT